MMTAQILDAVLSAITVVFLGAIGRGVLGLRKDAKRFMTEHMWLLATTLWTRDKVLVIMDQLGLEPDNPPPVDLPNGAGGKKGK